jgi:hypothetical protein
MESQFTPKKTVEVEVRVAQWVVVNVPLNDIETQDLIDELCRRGESMPVTALAERAYLTLPKDAPDVVREFVAAHAGRIW